MDTSYQKINNSVGKGSIKLLPIFSRRNEDFYCAILAVVIILLASVYPLLEQSTYKGCQNFHATIEMVGALIGLIAGLALISYFYALGNRFHLFIGLAFFINGAEDFVHGFLDFSSYLGWVGLPKSSLDQFIPGTYVTGRLLMAMILILSPFISEWMGKPRSLRKETILVSFSAISISCLCTVLAFYIPLPEFIFPSLNISRPMDFLSAVLFGVALFLFLRRYYKDHNMLTWWIALSISVNIIGQSFMSLSKELYDPFFDIAHVYKVLGYAIPLIGFSLYQITEIVERKKSEEELRKTKDHLDNLIESSLDCIVVSNNKGYVTKVNKSFKKLLSCREEDVIGKHMAEFSPTEEGTYKSTTGELVEINEGFFNDTKMWVSRLVEDGKISNLESYLIRNDNKVIPVEENLVYFYDKGGDRIGAVGVIRDITDRKRAEKEIKEASDFLKNVIESSTDGIITVDERGCIISCNSAMEEMSGFSKEEMIGKHASVLTIEDKELREKILEKTAELFEKGFAAYESMFKSKEGKYIDVECTSSMVRNEKGDYIAGVSVIRDISERKRFEQTLKQSEERYHDLIEFANVGIIVAEDDRITNVNKRAEEIYGYTKEELIGQSPRILTLEKYRKKHQEVLDEIVNYGKSKRTIFEEEGIKKDGTIFLIEISFSLTRKENKTIIAVIRDLTEKKKSEKEIREAKEFLENLFKTSTDAIMVTDPQGNITMVNDAMEKIVGYSRDDLLGKHTSIFTPLDERIRSNALRNMERLFREGQIYGHESVWQTKDDQHIFVELNLSLLKDKDGNVVGGVNFIRDVTRRKQMEQQLLQSEKLKSLGELSGGVAHDFNNVLAAILGRVQLLKMQVKPPSGKQEKRKSMFDLIKSLEIIERASLDGAETVRRIQEFSRKRADDRDFTVTDINELLDNALEFTSMRWKNDAESKGIKITIQKEFLPLPSTLGSASELREVFTNIINNALDAMPQGGSIKIKTFKEDSHISIKVEDTGVGIPKTIRNRIFDPFFTTKGVQSTGLGMSVSYGIINRHGGTIIVDSVEGEGTTFTIKLPISENILVEEEKTKPIPKESRKSTILVIEDEEEVRNLLADILIENGHQVETASDGNQGIEMFKKKDFDLVFTDLGIPGTSGWEVAETVKSINERIPVAIITGWNVELKESEMRERGVNLIVYKPFEVNQVLKLVQEGMLLRDQLKAV